MSYPASDDDRWVAMREIIRELYGWVKELDPEPMIISSYLSDPYDGFAEDLLK